MSSVGIVLTLGGVLESGRADASAYGSCLKVVPVDRGDHLRSNSLALDERPDLVGTRCRRTTLMLAVERLCTPLALCVPVTLAVDSYATEVVAVVVAGHGMRSLVKVIGLCVGEYDGGGDES